MQKGGRRCQYFKEEEQHEKGHRGIICNNLFVGLMIILKWLENSTPGRRLVGNEAGSGYRDDS